MTTYLATIHPVIKGQECGERKFFTDDELNAPPLAMVAMNVLLSGGNGPTNDEHLNALIRSANDHAVPKRAGL